MKTTIDIPTALLDQARELARKEDRTVKSLVEEALRRLIAEHASRPKRVLRDASVPGILTPEYRGKTVTEMIHEDYEDRIDRSMGRLDDRG